MKFQVEIECDSAAFGENAQERGDEVLGILEDLCKKVEAHGVKVGCYYRLFDTNGNFVGGAEGVE